MSEPDSYISGLWSPAGDRLVESLRQASLNLAELLDVINRQTAPVHGKTIGLEQKLDIVSEKLDRTNELLHNMIQVLSSRQ